MPPASALPHACALPSFLNPIPLGLLHEKPHDRTASAAEIRVEQLSPSEDDAGLIGKTNGAGFGILVQPQARDHIATAAVGTRCASPIVIPKTFSGIRSLITHVRLPSLPPKAHSIAILRAVPESLPPAKCHPDQAGF